MGAEAMVRRLVERGAIGLVTTHDLALAQIANGLGPRATNAHFEDCLEDGKLVFDYRLQPGIVETSNALSLMRSIGLDVELALWVTPDMPTALPSAYSLLLFTSTLSSAAGSSNN